MSNVQSAAAAVALKPVFQTPDGKTFDTKAEAQDHIRRPLIHSALTVLTSNPELSDWLIDNRETVEIAFETGTIRRVTKSEAKKLNDALDYIAATLADDKKAAFAVENIAAIKDSFRWPSVKRMDDAEKATAARNTLAAAANGNEELATWIVGNKDGILAAYQAGVVKREVSERAASGLEAYRQKRAAEKKAAEEAAAAAAAANGGEAAPQ